MDRRMLLALVATVTLAVTVASGISWYLVSGSSNRLGPVEEGLDGLRGQLESVEAQLAEAGDQRAALMSRLDNIESGVVRIALTGNHQPTGSHGGIQAFVETGSVEPGCIASVSATNVGDSGPFYVVCTTWAPIIDGQERMGLWFHVRTADGSAFPDFAIVELTVWQPGAERHGEPVACPFSASREC